MLRRVRPSGSAFAEISPARVFYGRISPNGFFFLSADDPDTNRSARGLIAGHRFGGRFFPGIVVRKERKTPPKKRQTKTTVP